jgi:hypothetical protein
VIIERPSSLLTAVTHVERYDCEINEGTPTAKSRLAVQPGDRIRKPFSIGLCI